MTRTEAWIAVVLLSLIAGVAVVVLSYLVGGAA